MKIDITLHQAKLIKACILYTLSGQVSEMTDNQRIALEELDCFFTLKITIAGAKKK